VDGVISGKKMERRNWTRALTINSMHVVAFGREVCGFLVGLLPAATSGVISPVPVTTCKGKSFCFFATFLCKACVNMHMCDVKASSPRSNWCNPGGNIQSPKAGSRPLWATRYYCVVKLECLISFGLWMCCFAADFDVIRRKLQHKNVSST